MTLLIKVLIAVVLFTTLGGLLVAAEEKKSDEAAAQLSDKEKLKIKDLQLAIQNNYLQQQQKQIELRDLQQNGTNMINQLQDEVKKAAAVSAQEEPDKWKGKNPDDYQLTDLQTLAIGKKAANASQPTPAAPTAAAKPATPVVKAVTKEAPKKK